MSISSDWPEVMAFLASRPPLDLKKKETKPDVFLPQKFSEYEGQTKAKELASVMIHAANKEHRDLPNIMIVGEYGLGKTALARLIMQAVGERATILDATSVNRMLPRGPVIIDEIHNLAPEITDSLNILIDQQEIAIIGCTTNPGKLSTAFRSRFRTLYLESYDFETLARILRRACNRKGVSYDKAALIELAKRSRFNARVATQYLAFVFDLISGTHKPVDSNVINKTFSMIGVDERGLLERDYKYLAAIPGERAVGLQFIEAVTGIDAKTIESEVEPYLLRLGFVDRTPRGRVKLKDK